MKCKKVYYPKKYEGGPSEFEKFTNSVKNKLLASGITITALSKLVIGLSCTATGLSMTFTPEDKSDIIFGIGFLITGIELLGSSVHSGKRAVKVLQYKSF